MSVLLDPSPPRALRAGVGAAVAVGVAAAAHGAAHGHVDVGTAAWTFLLLVGPAWWLARRQRRWGALAATQLGGQQIAHVVLTTATPAVGTHHAPADLMLYAHLLGAALSAAWLVRGERRAWSALRRLSVAVLDPFPGTPRSPLRTVPRSRPRASQRPVDQVLRHVVSRRGPPRLLASS